MAYQCIYCANKVTVGTDTVLLEFTTPVSVTDKDRFCFKLCQSIPATAAQLPVRVAANGTNYPLWNKYGNPILGSQLTNRKYVGYYGATTPHVIITNTPFVTGCEKVVY